MTSPVWQTPVWSSRWRWAAMRPAPLWVAQCELPNLASVGELADWLGLPANELAALADWRSLERFAPPGPLRNYPFAHRAYRLATNVATICLDEGFPVQHRKTRIRRAAARQQAAGVVLNVRPNIPRDDYDRLKAILHNCRRHGPGSQNRDNIADFCAHLLGRIAHIAMLHAERGQRLIAIFNGIGWEENN